MVAAPTIEHEIRGAPLKLLRELMAPREKRQVVEYVIDGPASTGKSRGIGHVLYTLMANYQGIRILVTRKTRRALSESFVVTWEQKVVPPGHPMLAGAARTNRHSYVWGKSELVLCGMDEPGNVYSTDFDVWYYQELFQGTEDEWMRARRALRNWGNPSLRFQLLLGDTNPDAVDHWINRRCLEGRTRRLSSRHEDNPANYVQDPVTGVWGWTPEGEALIESLDSLKLTDENPGVLYLRLRKGIWCSASGAVWSNYNRELHEIDRPRVVVERGPRESDAAYLKRCTAAFAEALGIKWFFGSVDWGFTDPGVLQVWGVAEGNRMYRVAEIFRTNEDIPTWAKWAVELHKEFEFRAIVCDPSRPDAIKLFNDYLGVPDEGPMRIARGANNKKTATAGGDMSGLDLVRTALQPMPDGRGPGMLFMRDSLRFGADQRLQQQRRPWFTEMEIPSYVYLERDDGRAVKEATDPKCSDHGCDATRYAASFILGDGFDLTPPAQPVSFPPNSYGAALGHAELFRQMRRNGRR